MSDFVVSARKYRPNNFDEIVGQSIITSTLKNAINSNQLAQSFLFCGPRGVGKTSCARIFANEINQFHNDNNVDDFSFNIFELDAASNNSVDDIRKLVDQVRFAPQVGKYNIYIIDEVHMLSTQAFNAFLKTLEEPPAHAKFILATTEKHKIIPTILSRCQIFDFKRIAIKDMIDYLVFVAQKEKISYEEQALHLIAEKSDGSMRDALSLFDMLASYSKGNISYQDVVSNLNVLDYEYYFNLLEAVLVKDIASVLNIFNTILENGFDAQHFINGLSNHVRDLLVSKKTDTIHLLEKGIDLRDRYIKQASIFQIKFIINMLELCNDCDLQYVNTHNKRLLVELCLLRICSLYDSENIIEKKNNTAVKKETDSLSMSVKNEDSFSAPTVKHDEKSIDSNLEKDYLSSSNGNSENQDISNRNLESADIKKKQESKTLSISATLEDISSKEEIVSQAEKLDIKKTVFNQDKLEEVWLDVVKFFQDQGKSNLVIAMTINNILLESGFCVKIFVSNMSQVELIEEEKYKILDLLRSKLLNDEVSIITEIIKHERKKINYTNKDKFERMLESNPSLESLKLKLGLDPDY